MWTCAAILAAGQGDPEFVQAASRTFARIREKISPAVVALRVERTKDPEGEGPRGKRQEHADYYSRPKGLATGTIFSADGLVVTSAFNVSGEITGITVFFEVPNAPGMLREAEAKLLGYDAEKDLAVLQFAAPGPLAVLEPANLDAAGVGDLAVAVGRSPDPEKPTVNFGILSAMHRFGGTHLQTDAELNYGNVGGPLVDLRGRLVGVTCQIQCRTPWGQSGGVGFAYRSDKLGAIVMELKAGRKIEKKKSTSKAFLGVVPGAAADLSGGIVVVDVLHDSPAARAGVQPGDVLLEFGGARVRTADELAKELAKRRPGDKVKLRIRRPSEEAPRELEVRLDVEPQY